MKLFNKEYSTDEPLLPMSHFYVVSCSSVALCFGFGWTIENDWCCRILEFLPYTGLLDGRLDFYEQYSPKSIPYYLAALVVFAPTVLVFWTITAVRYRSAVKNSKRADSLDALSSIFVIVFTVVCVHTCFLRVPADFDGLGGIIAFPAFPFISAGIAFLTTAAIFPILPLVFVRKS